MSQIENIPLLGQSGSTECNTCSLLETISAPNLSDANYGSSIDSVFDNINKNFKVVANHDFIKGENGDTIEVEYVNLNKGETGKQLYEALKLVLFEETPSLVSLHSWDEDITNYEVPLVVISNINTNKKEYIGGAAPILFIDYRFSSNVLESVSQDSYIDITNLSCIVNFKFVNNKWTCEIDNSFPRIQYNSDKKYFEWLLNNEGTTICATGIKGDKGDKLTMHFKEVNIGGLKDGMFEVKYYDNELISEGDPVLLYLYEKNGELVNYKGYFIGCVDSVDVEHNIFLVKYNENNVNKVDFANNTYEFFKSLSINNTEPNTPAQGIFLPIPNSSSTDVYQAFAMYCNTDENLYIGHINDFRNFNSGSTQSKDIIFTNKVNVNKSINIRGGANIDNGGLAVSGGTATFESGVQINKGVNIKGGANIDNGGLAVSGGTATFESGVQINKGVNIKGGANIDNGGLTVMCTGNIYGPSGSDGSNGGEGLIILGGKAGKPTADAKHTVGGAGIKVYGGNPYENSADSSKGNAIEATGNIKVDSGKIESSGGFYETSDERLKDFHEDIEVCLDDITKLPKKYFTWKDDDAKTSNIGTSAQEVQKLYPELVSKDSEGNLLVAYDKLSIIALKAIDILSERNKELEQRIEKLEKLIK